MSDTPKSPFDIGSFYKGADPVVTETETQVGPIIHGGVYTPEENAASATYLNTEIIPGSWRDLEMRGVPTIQWPDDVMAQFIEDQSKPQSIWNDPRLTGAAPAITTGDSIRSSDIPMVLGEPDYSAVINSLVSEIHQANVAAGWWNDIITGETLLGKDEHGRDRRNVGELLMLVVSEVAEAMEGYRKNLMDDKLPHRKMLEVEMADCLIRIFDIAGAHNLDLGGAIAEKRAFNATRADHKIENRLGENGKKF